VRAKVLVGEHVVFRHMSVGMRRYSEVGTFGEHGCDVGKVTWRDTFHDEVSGLDPWEMVTVILAILHMMGTDVLT
jgi:hypothetical protein